MRYHFDKPEIYLSLYGERYICEHPVYNSVEDYDWYDIVLLPTEIEQLMDLAMKALREEAETRVLAKEEKA